MRGDTRPSCPSTKTVLYDSRITMVFACSDDVGHVERGREEGSDDYFHYSRRYDIYWVDPPSVSRETEG